MVNGKYKFIGLEERPELMRLTDPIDIVKTRIASIEKQMQKLAVRLKKGEITCEEFVREYNILKVLIGGYKELLSGLDR